MYYSEDTVEMQFTWLGRPRTITSHRSLEYLTWSPEYIEQVSRWMRKGEIWFITSKESAIPPAYVKTDQYAITCLEVPVPTTHRITKCTQSNLSHSENNAPKEVTTTQSELSDQLALLNENISLLNQSLQTISLPASNAYESLQTKTPTPMYPSQYEHVTVPSSSTTTDNDHRPTSSDLEFYLSTDLAEPGDTIDIYISSPTSTVDLRIFQNTSQGPMLLKTISNVEVTSQKLSKNGWLGAQWTSTLKFTIPKQWDSDLYVMQVKTSTAKYNAGITIHNPDFNHDGILILEPNLTRHAYCNWGGKSMYGYNSTNSLAAESVSALRPTGGLQNESLNLDRWIEDGGYTPDYITMTRFDDPDFSMTDYKVIIVVGHNEYWSLASTKTFQQFVANGGHAIIVSGNTMWWETESQNSMHTVYKTVPATQQNKLHFGMTTIESTIGVNFDNAGYISELSAEMKQNGNGGFVVHNSRHWTLVNSKLRKGDTFGSEHNIAGYEVDGATMDWSLTDGKVKIDSYPENINLIAYALSKRPNKQDGLGTVITYQPTPNSGCIFNAASIQWVNGLWDPKNNVVLQTPVHTMTHLILQEFLTDTPKCLEESKR